ncbi:hypothetical protein AAFC00_001542 [Neodothiora populina]
MGGQALPWEWDADLESKLNSRPSEKFPPIAPPTAEPPSAYERRSCSHYRTLRARVHDGPFYSILDSSARVSKKSMSNLSSSTTKRSAPSPPAAHFDPFEGAQTYSQRFVRKRNTLPRLSTRPFVMEFFPRELWSTIDPSNRGGVGTKRGLQLHTRTKVDKWALLANLNGNDSNGSDEANGGNANDDEHENDDDADPKPDDEDQQDEDPDQFAEDEEDDDDDYNAENYFDGGDDDDYGGDEGGGGDGDDF